MSEADFVAAQNVTARSRAADRSSRTYLLTGLLRCGVCGRSMDSQSSHGNPAYRCRHGHTRAQTQGMRRARNLYLREDVIVGRVFAQLHNLTCRAVGVQEQIVDLRQARIAVDLARFLRTHNITIECHPTGVSLEPDHEETIVDRTPASAATAAEESHGSGAISRDRSEASPNVDASRGLACPKGDLNPHGPRHPRVASVHVVQSTG